jgi:hypothetical protein
MTANFQALETTVKRFKAFPDVAQSSAISPSQPFSMLCGYLLASILRALGQRT